ncbi:MAG: FG-GAP-like repeat-containing protein [bacterium]
MKRPWRVTTWHFAPAITFFLVSASVALGTMYYVAPGGSDTPPYTNWAMAAHSISSAVARAVNGDDVRVSNGTYYITSQILITNGITVRSEDAAGVTTVDGQHAVRCFRIEHADAILNGFTITNGAVNGHGAGVSMTAGTVKNCVITDNVITNGAYKNGGGIYLDGGGLVQDCEIRNNRALQADGEGGGVAINEDGLVERCLIEGNRASEYGGGVKIYNDGILRNCQIINNTVANRGGGVSFLGDIAGVKGYVQNCTVYGNTAYEAGGIDGRSSKFEVRNCIVYSNVAQNADDNIGTLGTPATFSHNCTVPSTGTACVTDEPWFEDQANGDYSLFSLSPCIDAGTNLVAVTNDYDGISRPRDGDIDGSAYHDIGAYEYRPPTCFPQCLFTNDAAVVDYEVTSMTVGGTMACMFRHLQWTNFNTGESGTIPATTNWWLVDLALGIGTNHVYVMGTNANGQGNGDNLYITRMGVPDRVTNTLPANAAIDVASNSDVSAWFSAPMDTATITSNTLFLHSRQSGMRQGSLSFGEGDKRVTMDPPTDFRPSELVHAALIKGITNAAGTSVLKPYTWSFYAEAPAGAGVLYESDQVVTSAQCGAIDLGDVDNDGDLDAFVARTAGNYIWLNDGNGVFTNTRSGVGSEALAAEFGDVDGDGDLDLVKGGSGGSILVYTNDGAGLFLDTGREVTVPNVEDLTLGDLDGDGDLDMVVSGASETRIYRNNGLGRFFYTGQSFGEGWGLDLGDVNGDGFLDLLMCGESWVDADNSRIYTNDGYGVFSWTGQALNTNCYSAALGDLDADGDLDIVFGGNSVARDEVWTNSGTGMFFKKGNFPGDLAAQTRDLALADLDADGDLDVVMAKYHAPHAVYLNDGSGGFTLVQETGHDEDNWWVGVALGDVDGDGAVDAILSGFSNNLVRLLINMPPEMAVRGTNDAVLVNGEAAAADKGTLFDTAVVGDIVAHDGCDVTNAGPTTLLITSITTNGTGASQFRIRFLGSSLAPGGLDPFRIEYMPTTLGMATATFAIVNNSTNNPFLICVQGEAVPLRVTNTTPPNAANDVATTVEVVAQFNRSMDGSTITSNRFFLYSGQRGFQRGAISFNPATNQATLEPASNLRPGEPVFAVLTRGISNAAASAQMQHHTWQFYAAVNGGGAFFVEGGQLGSGSGRDVALGDLDNDGDLDAFVVNEITEGNTVWTNDGTGALFDTGQNLGTNESRGVALGDVDNDGDLDAYVVNWEQRAILWTNDGNGTFGDSGQQLSQLRARSVSLADVNGDGALDAYIVKSSDPDQVWTNDGSGVFSLAQAIASAPGSDAAFGDVNGDGFLDVFAVNYNDANLVFTNNGDGNLSSSGQSLGAWNSRAVALGDLNGDGWLDAFVANENEGNRVWTNDGAGVFSHNGQSLGTEASRGVALGDLDGDGDLDAFVANYDQPNTVWTNDGNGLFYDAGLALGTGASWRVRLGDLNGDGCLDAYVVNFAQPDEVWLNATRITATCGPHGTISPSGTVVVAPGSTTSFVTTADTYYNIGQLLTNGAPDAAAPGLAVYTSVWANVSADGTLSVSFAENLAPLGTPEWWLAMYGWTNNFGSWETNDTDNDSFFAWQEQIADTVPTNGESYFHVINLRRTNSMAVVFDSSTQRVYSLEGCGDMVDGSWLMVDGATNVPGDVSGTTTLIDTNDAVHEAYRVGVSLP